MNTLRTDYNVRVIREPSGEEISLEVTPGTVEAEVVESAAVAAMYQAQKDGHPLTARQMWGIRTPFLNLRRANYKVLNNGDVHVDPIMLRGDAAAATLEGLAALPLEAQEARKRLDDNNLNESDYRAFAPAVEIMEERAKVAEIIQAEVLDQGAALGQAAMHAMRVQSPELV